MDRRVHYGYVFIHNDRVTGFGMVDEAFLEFEWLVSVEGYEWVDAGELGLQIRAIGNRWKKTDPLKTPGLFQEFIETPAEPDAILAFTHRHGVLGDGEGPKRPHRLNWWIDEQTRMRIAFDLFRFVRDEAMESVQTLLSIGASNKIEVADGAKPVLAAWAWDRNEDGPRIRKGRSGYYQVGYEAVCHLASASHRFVPVQFQHDPNKGFSRRLKPEGLLDALWLQFGAVLTNDSRLITCLGCGSTFVLDRSDSRSDRRYCRGNACKMKVYRRRKKATALRKKGLSPKQISERLGEDLHIVRHWLAS